MMIALWTVGVVLLGLAGWLWWHLVGATLDAATVRERILALDKNAPLRAAGVEVVRFTARLDDTDVATAMPVVRIPGTGDVPPIVLVHPTPHSMATWTEVVFGGERDGERFDGLAGGAAEVVLLDVIGHGGTAARLPGPCTFQLCSDWLGQALDALGLAGVCLVGQSYGGEFCWRLAVDRPELVRSLVLIDSAGVPRRDGDWLSEEKVMRSTSLAKLGYALNSRERIRGALAPHFREPVSADRVAEVFLVCENPTNWRAMVDLCRDENGERVADLARVTQPTTVVWGADDVAYDPAHYAQAFVERLPDARLVEVPACGHYPQEERPREVIRAIRAAVTPR